MIILLLFNISVHILCASTSLYGLLFSESSHALLLTSSLLPICRLMKYFYTVIFYQPCSNNDGGIFTSTTMFLGIFSFRPFCMMNKQSVVLSTSFPNKVVCLWCSSDVRTFTSKPCCVCKKSKCQVETFATLYNAGCNGGMI